MITLYLLVIMSRTYGGNMAFSTEKFYSEEACKQAKAAILNIGKGDGSFGGDLAPRAMKCYPIQEKLPNREYSI